MDISLYPELISKFKQWYDAGCSTLLDEHDAKAEAKRCGGSATWFYAKRRAANCWDNK